MKILVSKVPSTCTSCLFYRKGGLVSERAWVARWHHHCKLAREKWKTDDWEENPDRPAFCPLADLSSISHKEENDHV